MVYALHVTADVATLSFLVGTIIPILVALVTRQSASSGTKAIVNALLATVAGVLSTLLAEAQGEVVEIELASFATAIGTAWVTSVATHAGLLKPTGITGEAGVVQRATANIGIGGSASAPAAGPPHSHG